MPMWALWAKTPVSLEVGPLPDGLSGSLAESLARLGPGLHAVRSSALDEDGALHSFHVGQRDTVLKAQGREAV